MSPTTVSETTGSKTIADLFRLAVNQYGERPFVVRKIDEAWVETTFAQAGEIVTEIGRGLIDLGLGPGERIGILSHTCPEWTYCDMAATSAGLAVVPVYPTNAPQEC